MRNKTGVKVSENKRRKVGWDWGDLRKELGVKLSENRRRKSGGNWA